MINFENVNNRLLLELEESKNTADGACKQEDIKQRIGIQMYKTSAGSMLRDTHTSVSILQDYFKDNLYVNQSQQRKSTTKDYTNLCAELLKSNAKEDCFKNLNEPVINPSIITFLNKRMNNCSNSQITDCDVGELFSTYDDFGSSDDNRDDDVENLIKTSTHEMNKTSSKRQLADAPDIQLKKKNTINIANTDGQSSRISPKSTDVQDIDQSNIQLPSNIFRTSSKEVIAPIKDNQPNNVKPSTSMFRTAKDELILQHHKSNGNKEHKNPLFSYSLGKKSLGTRRTVESKFVLPTLDKVDNLTNMKNNEENNVSDDAEMIDERLKHIDPKMIEIIRNEIMNTDIAVEWDDIAGLEYAKLTIKEAVVWPLLRPDIFTGLRRPPRGILLFGPPGTGKTLIGKCIASQSRSTFFSISASSLTSKYVGEGEKMVRALFEVASIHQPAVVFIDEIDSLLCQRSDTEHESSRRIKTEFLVQLDGAGTSEDDRILFVGTTNRPQELDEAARRRFVKRLYIPLPELAARVDILKFLIKKERTELSEHEINEIGELTTGFSGADIKTLCHEASMGPIRAIPIDQMHLINVQDVRPINFIDFKAALSRVRASVSQEGLLPYLQWDSIYGSGAAKLNIS